MTGHKELKCKVYPLEALDNLKFVVVCTFCDGKYVLSYHRKHESWETQGGHIEDGESPYEAARRELYEESGITDTELIPVCDYNAIDSEGTSNGRVYAARIRHLEELPKSEMSSVKVFDVLPDNLTYPLVTPVLFRESEKVLERV